MIRACNATTARRLGVALAVGLLALSGCATAPPRNSQSICQVFDQYPDWYRDARAAQKRWGTPVNVLMAFVQRESDFREKARPGRPHFLFIPLPRRSSAYGYAQAQDPVWQEYRKANGRWFISMLGVHRDWRGSGVGSALLAVADDKRAAVREVEEDGKMAHHPSPSARTRPAPLSPRTRRR